MNSMIKAFQRNIMMAALLVTLAASCNRDDYFVDGGKHDAKYNGTILQYLNSKPEQFDTLVQVIKLAGLESVFNADTLTFFASPNRCFTSLIRNSLNPNLFKTGKDTVKTLDEIPAAIWRKYLTQYMFRGAWKQNDYPQVDPAAKALFPGQNTKSYDGDILNIGVFYNDAGTTQTGIIKYAGFRQLYLSFIPNLAQPFDNWNIVRVSSSDIQPANGVVHSLYASQVFGFDATNFYLDVNATR